MDAALNAIVGPWSQLGILGSVVLARGAVIIFLWRRHEALQRAIDALYEARLADRERYSDRIADLLVRSLDTSNRVSDGMEAMERIFEKVKT